MMRGGYIKIVLKFYTRVVAILLILVGFYLSLGGWTLMSYGGSWYYLLMGIALLIAGISMIMLNVIGVFIYYLSYIATVIWAIAEVGLDFWPLAARLAALGLLAILVTFTYPILMKYNGSLAHHRGGYLLGILLSFVFVGFVVVSSYFQYGYYAVNKPLLKAIDNSEAPTDWQQYANTAMGTRYSGAKQITPANVKKLNIAWRFRVGETPSKSATGADHYTTPLFVGNTLYACTPSSHIFAIAPESGTPLWSYAPNTDRPGCRGLAYYQGSLLVNNSLMVSPDAENEQSVLQEQELATLGDEKAQKHVGVTACKNRIFINTVDDKLLALDAQSGTLCKSFGNQGTIDLTSSISAINTSHNEVSLPPIVVGELVIVANHLASELQAYDVHTGQLIWTWKQGADDSTLLASPTYDSEFDLIYVPISKNPTPFLVEDNDQYASYLVAIDGKTGKTSWQYQMPKENTQRYTLASQPILYDMTLSKGNVVPTLLQSGKNGGFLVLNRLTGQLITNHVKPHHSKKLQETDMWGITPFDQLECRIEFASIRHSGTKNHVLKEPTLSHSGMSIDPSAEYLFINDRRIGLVHKAITSQDIRPNNKGIKMGLLAHIRQIPFSSILGLPCQAPPYGTMTAIDLKTKKEVWKIPVGNLMIKEVLGIPVFLPFPLSLGMPTSGSSIVTQTGLLFFAGSGDFYLRAYDSYTGQELWKDRLPKGSQSEPITFILDKTGKQYLVVIGSEMHQTGKKEEYIIAWSLPN